MNDTRHHSVRYQTGHHSVRYQTLQDACRLAKPGYYCVSNLALLLVVFKWHYGSEGVKIKTKPRQRQF